MTNEINSIFEFIVIILTCILLAILPANGTTLTEDVEIVNFLQNICNDYEKPCEKNYFSCVGFKKGNF